MAVSDTVSGSLTAVGNGYAFQPAPNNPFSVYIYGSFAATAVVQRSFDLGTTWVTVPKPDLTDASFTAPINFSAEEPVPGTLWRVRCSAYTSGTISYQFIQ